MASQTANKYRRRGRPARQKSQTERAAQRIIASAGRQAIPLPCARGSVLPRTIDKAWRARRPSPFVLVQLTLVSDRSGEAVTAAAMEADVAGQDVPLTSLVASIEGSQLECSVCLSLLCQPVSLPCGHTFCRICLATAQQRSRKKCPNCRAVCHMAAESHPENVVIASIARTCFPDVYERRLADVAYDRQRLLQTLPIFFYNNTLFPDYVLSLHLFEPRYRVRRIRHALCAHPLTPSAFFLSLSLHST